MAQPIVIVTSGGLAITESANGIGLPVVIADNGFGIPCRLVDSGGLPVLEGASNPAQYATTPAPSGFHWEFVTESGVRVTENAIPVVELATN